ncbi:MAG: TonB-dependent receptor [Bacteroidetes bacterium]|nr:TonB-dependent receptor [Bacteroidota bacterium]
MLRNLLLAIALVLTTNLLVHSQTGSGTLKGKITDKKTKEAIPFANIIVEIGGVQVGGSTTDFDGNFIIKPIPPGKVDLKATFVGYTPFTMKGIVVFADKIQFQNVELQPQSVDLSVVEVVDYKVPLISKDQTVSGGTVSSEDIAKMANKSAEAVATTVGGVGTDANGGITSMRGQRSTGTVYYIDGIRVIGNNALPQSAIEQVEVILGGTPASYGDATGGIISVTTKGPSRETSVGIDAQTSKFLDRFGYNRVGLNVTGPVFSKKDTINKTKTPVMGYFVAGEFVYQKDGAPGAYKYYRATDDVINSLKYNPIRLSANGQGVELNAEYLTKNDLMQVKNTQNTSYYNVNASGKLDFRLSPTINLSFGGTFTYNDNYGFNYAGSLLNWEYNSHNTSSTWRLNGRFTQRFPTAPDSKSFVKNVYYSIGADFSRSDAKSEDSQLKEDLFKYGYIGSFATQKVRGYTTGLERDSLTGKMARLHNGWRDTGVIFTANNYNPEAVAWVDEYYNLLPKVKTDGTGNGNYLSTSDITGNRGLINGMEPIGVYAPSMWQNVGTRRSGYAYNQQDQTNVQASFAADFGNHEIQVGLQYQQRKNSAYGVDGQDMWPLMNLEANSHINERDLSNPQLVYRDGFFMDTINYFRKYSSTLQKNFDINLRQKLGLPLDGTDWIDVNSYNFDAGTINYYDKNQKMHTIRLNENLLSIDMFTPDELFQNGSPLVAYSGYDYKGKKLNHQPTLDDFFNKTDANGNFTREVAAYQPIYMAGYIQDKFAFKDLIFNIGLRVDRFDANQMVLKDPYLFYPAKTVAELDPKVWKNIPSNIGSDYVVYVDDPSNPSAITGYRKDNQWYNKDGTPVSDPKAVDATGVKPYLLKPSNTTMSTVVFQDYQPQVNYMPRISFSFPISDDALFYAHYDILTQRPSSGFVQLDPVGYYFIGVTGSNGTHTNPALKPEKTIDYELGFQQKINNASSLKLSVFYREMRDQIQQYRLSGAYPKTYYSYTNIDFGTVKGLTVSYDLRRTGNARIRFSYTLQFADGTGSDANAASTIVRSDQPNLRTMNPLNFDRRHAFNAEFDYRWSSGKDYNGPVINRRKSGKPPVQFLSNFGGNLTLTGGSGTPYTKSSQVIQYGGMGPIEGSVNGSRLPWQFLLNLKIDKDFNFAMGKGKKKPATINVYIEILNLMNTKNVTAVYPATGSPTDDGYLSAPEYQTQISQQVNEAAYRDLYSIYMDRPFNFSSPRQTRLGVMFNF